MMQQKKLAIKFLPKLKNLLISNKYNFKLTASYTDSLDTVLEEFENDKFKILLHSNTYAEEVVSSGDVDLIEKEIETIFKIHML